MHKGSIPALTLDLGASLQLRRPGSGPAQAGHTLGDKTVTGLLCLGRGPGVAPPGCKWLLQEYGGRGPRRSD